MIRYAFISFLVCMALGICVLAGCSIVSSIKSPLKKEYDKGYRQGYADGISFYEGENARRDSTEALRNRQFIAQMQRMDILIRKYREATRHMQGI